MNDNKLKKQIRDCLYELQATDYKKGVDWNGYEVLIPIHKKSLGFCIGLPDVILVKNGTARISDPDEAIAYLNFPKKKSKQQTKSQEKVQ